MNERRRRQKGDGRSGRFAIGCLPVDVTSAVTRCSHSQKKRRRRRRETIVRRTTLIERKEKERGDRTEREVQCGPRCACKECAKTTTKKRESVLADSEADTRSLKIPSAMEDLGEMDCPVVKRFLKDDGPKCLLLDCRSFLAFNAGHIRGAVNARCNTIVRRRAKGSVLSLDQILAGDEEVRGRLRAGMYSAVVLYDERTPDSDTVKEDSTLTLVLNAVCGDSSGTQIYLLKGGYDRFFSEYPEFCMKTKSLPSLSSQSSVDSSCSSCGTPHHDQGGPVEILPFLYLGSALHASKKEVLDNMGISALLNVSADCPNHFEGAYQYKCIPVEDNHKEDISCWFLEAIEFIDSVRDASGRVLVHCQAGISRSATICLAYLMKRKRVRLDEAFEFVRRRRSIISPNFSFMGQLLQFESQLLATTSCAAEAAATASPLLGPKSSATATVTSATPTSPFIFNFPVSVVNSAYLHHSPITTSPGC